MTRTELTRPQRIALAHHCRLAGECVNPLFVRRQGRHHSVVLTVNSGYE